MMLANYNYNQCIRKPKYYSFKIICFGTKVPRHSAEISYVLMSSKAHASNHVAIQNTLVQDVMIATFRQALPQPSKFVLDGLAQVSQGPLCLSRPSHFCSLEKVKECVSALC